MGTPGPSAPSLPPSLRKTQQSAHEGQGHGRNDLDQVLISDTLLVPRYPATLLMNQDIMIE